MQFGTQCAIFENLLASCHSLQGQVVLAGSAWPIERPHGLSCYRACYYGVGQLLSTTGLIGWANHEANQGSALEVLAIKCRVMIAVCIQLNWTAQGCYDLNKNWLGSRCSVIQIMLF